MQNDFWFHKNFAFLNFYSMLLALCSTLRYRFFLFAGIFPYLLGQVIAWSVFKTLNWHYSWWGFLGILLALTGVELLNEYFDSSTTLTVNPERSRRIDAKSGGDRIFLEEKPEIPAYFFLLGIFAFVLAFVIGLYLTLRVGWSILLFSFLGFLGAYFYVGPPIRWAYRGLGEIVIALCYGPFMVLGSFYLQVKRIDFIPLFASSICGLSLFCLALLNEIPDYYQDRLVGKRNLVVRLGKQNSVRLLSLTLACLFLFLVLGVARKQIPLLALVSFFFLPWILKSLARVKRNYENPKSFISAIKATVVVYLVIMSSLGIGYLGS